MLTNRKETFQQETVKKFCWLWKEEAKKAGGGEGKRKKKTLKARTERSCKVAAPYYLSSNALNTNWLPMLKLNRSKLDCSFFFTHLNIHHIFIINVSVSKNIFFSAKIKRKTQKQYKQKIR